MTSYIKNKLLKLIKNVNYGLGIITLVVIIYIMFTKTPMGVAFAVQVPENPFEIIAYFTNESGTIKAPNLAPGDKINGELIVKNEGQIDFTYFISAVKESGDDSFYNVLDLTIEDGSNNKLYFGKLKDLDNNFLGILGKQCNTLLYFEVSLPSTCDNTYQGLNTSVKFVLNAIEHPCTFPQGEVVWDPPLEKPDCYVRNGNVMPISFHLVKDGIFDTQKRGVDLEITGEDNFGKPVVYLFSVVNNTLFWKAQELNKPHYSLMFDTEKYPVLEDTYYKATVKFGDEILGYTEFKSANKCD